MWYGADMPYGGYKNSGIGRLNGIEGFEQYLRTRSVAFAQSGHDVTYAVAFMRANFLVAGGARL